MSSGLIDGGCKSSNLNKIALSGGSSQRASPAVSLNFCRVWRINSDYFRLPTHFFKYTFQQTLYLFFILLKYYFFILLKYYFFIISLFFFLIFLHSFIMSIFFKFQTTLTIIFFLMRSVVSITFFSQYFHNKILYGKLLLVLI